VVKSYGALNLSQPLKEGEEADGVDTCTAKLSAFFRIDREMRIVLDRVRF
jgi:hypothetical protein